jgi:hypothetical protein
VIIAYIVTGILVGGVAVSIIGQSVWLRKLVKGEITPEEFERGRVEWGSPSEVGKLYLRLGNTLVGQGQRILGKLKERGIEENGDKHEDR